VSGLLDQTFGDLAIADRGFASRDVVQLTLRRIGLRAAVSSARASVDALAHLLDQQRQTLRGDGAALTGESVRLTCGDSERGVCGAAVNRGEGHALREDELLQGVKLIAQLLDRIDIGIRHGLFSSGGEPEGIDAGSAAHRLSGDAK